MPQICVCYHPQFSPLAEIVALCEQYGLGIELSAFSDVAVVRNINSLETYRAHQSGVFTALFMVHIWIYIPATPMPA